MTYLEIGQQFIPELTAQDATHILWDQTAYPFSGVRMTIKQFTSALRASKNHRGLGCMCCGTRMGFHKSDCIEYRGRRHASNPV